MYNRSRNLHPDFLKCLSHYDEVLVNSFVEARDFVLFLYPESNELLYHTQALTTVFSPSLKLSDAFCHIPIYSRHFNLGFNYGTLLADPKKLLKGTGKLIRHIPILDRRDFDNDAVRDLIQAAIQYSIEDMDGEKVIGKTISKIKPKT